MKLAEVWQSLMGHVDDIEDLGTGHESGLDLRSEKGLYIMELKNSVHTDNASSRQHNLSKLKKYVMHHPKYHAIYGFVNGTTEQGIDEIKTYDGWKVRYLSGSKLLRFIFGDDYSNILQILKEKIKIYL